MDEHNEVAQQLSANVRCQYQMVSLFCFIKHWVYYQWCPYQQTGWWKKTF